MKHPMTQVPASISPPPAARGTTTMADVAVMAGVSLKSVSRVINQEPHISAKLKARVEAAIAALDYVPDTAARSLAGARSFMLGVLFDNPSPNYTMAIVSGIYAACLQAKHHLRFDNLDTKAPDDDVIAQLERILRHSKVDGLVLTPPITDKAIVLEYLESRRIPLVRITPVLDPDRTSMVWMDNVAAGAAIADYFWARGHRRFGIATGPTEHGDADLRRAGFVDRLRERDPDIVISEAAGAYLFETGIAAGHALLGAKPHPTAIFATNDDSAAGVMVAARQLGLSVPEDVSVCGFDDSWVAKSVWPYLTTIRQPIEDMARAAAQILLDRGNAGATQFRQLDFALIERDSVADIS